MFAAVGEKNGVLAVEFATRSKGKVGLESHWKSAFVNGVAYGGNSSRGGAS
jgi:hypothetical protein